MSHGRDARKHVAGQQPQSEPIRVVEYSRIIGLHAQRRGNRPGRTGRDPNV
jgi:hypothetical protein